MAILELISILGRELSDCWGLSMMACSSDDLAWEACRDEVARGLGHSLSESQ